jgi:hypothetical protein
MNTTTESSLKIRVVGDRWSADAEYTVTQLCLKYSLPFIDRGGITASTALEGINVLLGSDDIQLPSSYAFFTHEGMADLPHTHNCKVVPLPPKVTTLEVPVDDTTNTRKIQVGSKRIRAEWKELQAKCKSATSLNEWLTAMHGLLNVTRYSVAQAAPESENRKFVWQQSPEKAKFEWPVDDLGAVPKGLVDELNSIVESFKKGFRVPLVVQTEKLISSKSFRAVVIDAYKWGVSDADEENPDIWVLTVKPVIIENGLY